MSREGQQGVVDFNGADLKALEEIAEQLAACRAASEKAGRPAHVLSVFLKMVDGKLNVFAKDLRERFKQPRMA